MADNSYIRETTDDLFINDARDILAVKRYETALFILRTYARLFSRNADC